MRMMFRFAFSLSLLPMLMILTGAASERPPNSGIIAIWYNGQNDPIISQPWIHGGQVMVQWADVDKGPGQYDFSSIESELSALAKTGRAATVQINGNKKPDYLFTMCPYFPKVLDNQINDKKGTLMYWHPAHEKAFRDMLAAFAKYIKSSPSRKALLGIRMNFNALGTEHVKVPEANQSLNGWITPQGVEPGTAWTQAQADAYKDRIFQTYIDEMVPDIFVFARSSEGKELVDKNEKYFMSGQMGLFHTSFRAEPTNEQQTFGRYGIYQKYCLPGYTLGYTEAEGDCWGQLGAKQTPRFCSPPQWNYWRLLSQMHIGVSYIGVYTRDLDVALNGKYDSKIQVKWPKGDVPQYQDEFRKAYEFANVYAGYHAIPAKSPGAWIAFREGNTLKGDYFMHMKRLQDETTVPPANTPIGPDNSRFGAWARYLPAGKSMNLVLNSAFADSLKNQQAEIRVTYLDDAAQGTLRLLAGGKTFEAPRKGSGQWQVLTGVVAGAELKPNATGAQITLEAKDAQIPLHMVEVVRK